MIKFFEDLSKLKSRNYRPINEAALQELMTSVRELGVQEPVRLFEVEETKEIFVLAGHHRVEAVRRLQAMCPAVSYRLPAIVLKGPMRELETAQSAIASVISNVLRAEMDVVDRAAAYRTLRDAGLSAESVARSVGKTRRAVEMTLTVDSLPDDIKTFIKATPTIKESAVYKAAARWRRDRTTDIKALLTTKPEARKKSDKGVVVDIEAFAEKLRTKLKLQEAVVTKVLSVL